MAKTRETLPIQTKAFPAFWCRCDGGADDPFYSPDGWCKCGVAKHHWHCQSCLGIAQVG
jgi:hypothetical protein